PNWLTILSIAFECHVNSLYDFLVSGLIGANRSINFWNVRTTTTNFLATSAFRRPSAINLRGLIGWVFSGPSGIGASNPALTTSQSRADLTLNQKQLVHCLTAALI